MNPSKKRTNIENYNFNRYLSHIDQKQNRYVDYYELKALHLTLGEEEYLKKMMRDYHILLINDPYLPDLEQEQFSDYTYLDDYLLKEFIPNYIKYVKIEEKTKKIAIIQLSRINKLHLNEEEFDYAMNFLKEQDIIVRGQKSQLEKDYENYIPYKYDTRQNYSQRNLTAEEISQLIKEFQSTGNISIRDQIIVENINLIYFFAERYARKYQVDQEELESYGYEILLQSINRFDPDFNVKFSTFLTNQLKYCFITKVANFYHFKNSELFWKYHREKNILKKSLK